MIHNEPPTSIATMTIVKMNGIKLHLPSSLEFSRKKNITCAISCKIASTDIET